MVDQVHPIAAKLGIFTRLQPDTDLYFYPDPDSKTIFEVARLSMDHECGLEFSVKDNTRIFSATFTRDGKPTSVTCSTGLPAGDTAAVVEMFCEEASQAFEDLVLVH